MTWNILDLSGYHKPQMGEGDSEQVVIARHGKVGVHL